MFYKSSENIEAMSSGSVPYVFDQPLENVST
jgi:hypothetical protein